MSYLKLINIPIHRSMSSQPSISAANAVITSPNIKQRFSSPVSHTYINVFDQLWNDNDTLQDATQQVIENISAIYNENAPELIYFMTIYNIFNEFLNDISDDTLPNDETEFKNSRIYHMLYNF